MRPRLPKCLRLCPSRSCSLWYLKMLEFKKSLMNNFNISFFIVDRRSVRFRYLPIIRQWYNIQCLVFGLANFLQNDVILGNYWWCTRNIWSAAHGQVIRSLSEVNRIAQNRIKTHRITCIIIYVLGLPCGLDLRSNFNLTFKVYMHWLASKWATQWC